MWIAPLLTPVLAEIAPRSERNFRDAQAERDQVLAEIAPRSERNTFGVVSAAAEVLAEIAPRSERNVRRTLHHPLKF